MDYHNIIITGASSGIGAALALEYATPGVNLFLFGRDKNRLIEVGNNCNAKGAISFTYPCDVTDKDSMAKYLGSIFSRHRVDLVIANAGISGGTSGTVESAEQTRKIYSTNIDGVLNTILPSIEYMTKNKHGSIAIMSSLASIRALPSCPAYSSSKACVKYLGEALRFNLAPFNVNLSIIMPGYIETPMTKVNPFYMPFLIKAEKAAKIIKKGIEKKHPRIFFPKIMYYAINFINILPNFIGDFIYKRLPSKPKID